MYSSWVSSKVKCGYSSDSVGKISSSTRVAQKVSFDYCFLLDVFYNNCFDSCIISHNGSSESRAVVDLRVFSKLQYQGSRFLAKAQQ